MKVSIIVNSKVFRKFLKDVKEKHINDPFTDEVTFSVKKGVLYVSGFERSVEHKGEGEAYVSLGSIHRMIKVLKQANEQPIRVEFEETWSSFNLLCNF